MIVDVNAWTGHWNTLPAPGDAASVRASLVPFGVDRICLAPLDAAWCPNPHRHNAAVYAAADRFPEVLPTPVLDPTLPTWREALAHAAAHPRVRLVKLLPAYSPYTLDAADALCAALAAAGLALSIQIRLDDPRRHHPLAQVPDVPVDAAADVAGRHPGLTVVLGGPTTTAIRALKSRMLALPNLYADVSQADGMDGLKTLAADGLTPKLLFGSHTPLFIPFSAVARVVNDLDEEDVRTIAGGNAERLLGL